MKSQYYHYFLAFFLTVKAFASPAELSFDTLRFAVIIDVPYAYYEDDTLVGYNIDFAKALAEKLNKKIALLACPVARCFMLMKNGQADILMDINKTPEREVYLSYLPSYRDQRDPLRFFTRKKDKIKIESQRDLATLSVGAIRGTSFSEKLQQEKKTTIVPLNTQNQLIKMLHLGRINAFMEREESLIKLPEYQRYKNEFETSQWQYTSVTPTYLAVSKLSSLNQHIALLTEKLIELEKEGVIESIFNAIKTPE
jgi:polar amino acid transport system substrate-binding protein